MLREGNHLVILEKLLKLSRRKIAEALLEINERQ